MHLTSMNNENCYLILIVHNYVICGKIGTTNN